MGFSAKEGEDVRWNREAFDNITNKEMDKGITLHYWYNKEKIKSFSINFIDLKKESGWSAIYFSVASLIPGAMIISLILSIIAGIVSLYGSISFTLSVSVVFKNGNALKSTTFYNDRLIFINSFTFYGYRYGSWIIPDIDDWRGHP